MSDTFLTFEQVLSEALQNPPGLKAISKSRWGVMKYLKDNGHDVTEDDIDFVRVANGYTYRLKDKSK